MAASAEASGRQERLAELHAREDALDTLLAGQIPEIQVNRQLRSANCQTVAAALPPGSVLVEFVRSERFVFEAVPARGQAKWQPARYLAFVLPAGAPDNVTVRDLGDAEVIDRAIAAFAHAVAGGRSSRQSTSADEPHAPEDDHGRGAIRDAARELASESTEPDTARVWSAATVLRRLAFDPLVPVLNGRTRLVLAPDGDLSRVPFQALPTDDGRYVLDTYLVSYLSVGRDALRLQAVTTPATTPAVVAADPDFDLGCTGGGPGKPFRHLSGTAQKASWSLDDWAANR